MCRLFSKTKKKARKEEKESGAVNIFLSLHILITRSIITYVLQHCRGKKIASLNEKQ